MIVTISNLSQTLYLFRTGLFEAAYDGGKQKDPSLKSATYNTIKKLGKVISYLNDIRKLYKSRDTPVEFC